MWRALWYLAVHSTVASQSEIRIPARRRAGLRASGVAMAKRKPCSCRRSTSPPHPHPGDFPGTLPRAGLDMARPAHAHRPRNTPARPHWISQGCVVYNRRSCHVHRGAGRGTRMEAPTTKPAVVWGPGLRPLLKTRPRWGYPAHSMGSARTFSFTGMPIH